MTRKRTRPRDRITQASCLLITALLILSAVSAGVGTGTASAEPAGMVSVPDQNITEDIPADASVPLGASQLHDGRILTDTHAMSLDVILTTPDRAADIAGRDSASVAGDMALILRDTEHSAGRRVAIDSGLLQTALGYEPEAIHGTHENGEQWTATAEYNDGYLVFDVPHFSTNVVEFTGKANVGFQMAQSGASTSWQLGTYEPASDINITTTGVSSSKSETISRNQGGGSFSVPINGNKDATDATLTLTGDTQTHSESVYGGASGSNAATESISPSGDTSLDNAQIEFSASAPSASDSTWGSMSGNEQESLSVYADDVSASEVQVIVDADIDGYYHTLGISGAIDTQIDLDKGDYTKTYTYSGKSPGTYDYTLETLSFHSSSSVSVTIKHVAAQPSQVTVNPDNGGSSSFNINPGTSYTKPIDIDRNTQTVDVSVDSGNLDYTISWDETHYTENPSVQFAGNTFSPGYLSDGETKQYDLGTLSPGSKTASVSVEGGGSMDIDISYTEHTVTTNPAITINGNTEQLYSGTLSDGQSVNTTLPKSYLQEGKNNASITLDGSVSNNAPIHAVNVSLTHSATDAIQQTYTGGTFQERYDISRTFASATAEATVTLPFSEDVVGVKNAEYQIGDQIWKPVPATDRRFDKTTLTMYISQLNGGELPAGAEVSVRATARKIEVLNGQVTITDPTKPGDPLDTQLKIQSRSADFAVNVGPTDDGDRIHYAYSSKYPTQDYVIIDGAGNQRLYLPESQPGDTFRMKHVRTKANVVSGDAKIRVVDPDDKKFEIMPGPGGDGDTVELTYYGTKPGNTYLLESLTREIILDTETANSPVTFVDDDSHEMWRILLESGGGGDTGGGGGLIGVASGAASSAGSAVSGLLPAISVPALGGIGGVGSAGFALILAGAVAVLVYGNVFGRITGIIASLNPFGGTPASGGGADTGNGGIDTSGVTSALSGVVTRAGRVGGTAGVRVLRATTQLLTTSTRIIGRESARLARYLAANPSVALGLGGVGVAVAAYQGLVQLTPQATTAILIGSGGLVTYLVLQRTGTFSWLSFGLIFGAFVILGAGAINPDVLASFGASLQDILPLLVIVGAYVVYRILQTRSQDASTPDTIVRFTGGGSGSDDNNN